MSMFQSVFAWSVLTIVGMSVLTMVGIHGFNLNVKNINVIRPDAGSRGALFGASVAIVQPVSGGNTLDLLVGAPNQNSSLGGENSGAIYRCPDIMRASATCQRPEFYDDDSALPGATTNEGFGDNIVVTASNDVLICSPQWKDTTYIRNQNFTFQLGRCTLKRSDNTMEVVRPYYVVGDRGKYTYRFENGVQYFWHGFATYGLSADSDGNSTYVIGAPGIFSFEGSVHVTNVKSKKSAEVPVELKINTKTAYAYAGYSVKVGRFCDDGVLCFATGAPNFNRVGEVFIYKWENEDERFLVKEYMIHGQQAWSNFGYSLGAVDVDKDGYDELLVGAPFFTEIEEKLQSGFDQGRVYVFSRSATQKDLTLKTTLDGSKQLFSRFGSAIGKIGDINLDTFPDIAVGAPGEDNGAGCIYLYMGTSVGFNKVSSQRLSAREIPVLLNVPVKGFGFAFSNSEIPRTKNYPIFAATSATSDTVAIFQCRPVVDVNVTMTAEPNPVNADSACELDDKIKGPCFLITLCIIHSFRAEKSLPLNYSISLDGDTLKSQSSKRLKLFHDSKVVEPYNISRLFVEASKLRCIDFTAELIEAQLNEDRFTPVQIVATYNLDSDIDPVLDALRPNKATLIVLFQNKCGPDKKCETDLKVSAIAVHKPPWQSIVVNYTKEFEIKIDLQNTKETAYWTVVTVEVNSTILFNKPKSYANCASRLPLNTGPSNSPSKPIDQAALTSVEETVVTCNFFKPIEKDGTISFTVAFDIDSFDLSKKILEIKVDAMPRDNVNNPEISPDDNKATVFSDVFIIANLSIGSSSSPVDHTVQTAKRIALNPDIDPLRNSRETKPMNITHKILVNNLGPSFLPSTTINVSVPIYLKDESRLVLKADVKMSTGDGHVTHCIESKVVVGPIIQSTTTTLSTSSHQHGTTYTSQTSDDPELSTKSETTTSEEISIVNRKRREVPAEKEKTYIVSCDDDPNRCQVYACDLNAVIQPKGYAEINVSMILDSSNIPIPQDMNIMLFVTKVQVKEPSHPLFKPWDKPSEQQTITPFHLVESGGKINIWIIIGCAIAGLILIIIIVIVLWKLGFFKRKKHQEVEKWRRESKRRSKKGYTKASTEEKGVEGAPDGGGVEI
ncbi:unnamed protein product [Lymnaea stagnalis]|uniref:Integrin alpha-2 domain-containing protein n=1 Tax=Lymnaea stagnalis TaxID=6523 RepID=A0AAV2H224_LYMST